MAAISTPVPDICTDEHEQIKWKILVVDDEAAIRRIVAYRLQQEGYEVLTAVNGVEGLEIFNQNLPDLVIVDLMLPEMGGFDLTDQIRKRSYVPLIILSAATDESSIIKGLELGADDFVKKPFSPVELETRIKGLLKRIGRVHSQAEQAQSQSNSVGQVISIDDIKIDITKRQVFRKSQRVHLTEKEFALLETLIKYSGEPMTHEHLLEEAWGFPVRTQSDVYIVRTHVSRLRSKLEDNPDEPTLIQTVRGIGYKLPKVN
ncbi:MAG: response regulator [Candidatus Melainabacteria bacterium]|nr:response regulator [Candidatus Melainabacteria bacterium]